MTFPSTIILLGMHLTQPTTIAPMAIVTSIKEKPPSPRTSPARYGILFSLLLEKPKRPGHPKSQVLGLFFCGALVFTMFSLEELQIPANLYEPVKHLMIC
jgi:hypothetical protein